MARLPSHLLIAALIRSVQDRGGFAMMLHKGDADAGSILIQTAEKGVFTGLYERVANGRGGYALEAAATSHWGDSAALAQYLEKRIRNDPDLWLIELDIPNSQRLIAEILPEG